MTARDWLNRRLRRLSFFIYGGIALFIGGIGLGVLLRQRPILAVSLPGFAVAFATMLFAQLFGLRCLFCGCNLGYLLNRGFFRVDPRVRFCPYCGGALDDDLPEPSEGNDMPLD